MHSILFKSIKRFFIIDSIKISIFIYSFTLELNVRSIASLFNLKFPFNLYLLLLNRKFELCIFSFLTFSFQIETTTDGSSVKTRGFFSFFRIERKIFFKNEASRKDRTMSEREREREYTKAYVGKAFSGQVSAIRSPSLSLSLTFNSTRRRGGYRTSH